MRWVLGHEGALFRLQSQCYGINGYDISLSSIDLVFLRIVFRVLDFVLRCVMSI